MNLVQAKDLYIYSKNDDICYDKCPNNTFPIICEANECNNNKECFDDKPDESYYLDEINQGYKKCYKSCKSCKGEGTESNHNCLECKDDYLFYNNSLNIANCYEKCDFFYYFNNNDFYCSETCPEGYKIILNKKKCIDRCYNDDFYQNEYNNTCYSYCPEGTYELEDKDDKICYDKVPIGYYPDYENKILKKCYDTCKKCNIGGEFKTHNCLECKDNYTSYNNPMNTINCNEKCNYYYFDDSNNFNCVKTCSGKYSKLIKELNKCVKQCKNEDIYRYEYNSICYNDCPNGTIKNEINYICTDDKYSEQTNSQSTDINCINKDDNKNEKLNELLNYVNNADTNNINNNNKESNKKKEDEVVGKFQELFNNGFDTSNIDKGNDFSINYNQIKYTITTTLNQKTNDNKDESTIDLGECEIILKDEYDIPENDTLYLFKIDAFVDNVFKVEYEVYYPFSPNNFTKLNLSICSGIKIDINIPINISPDEIDKYNISSGLYNDICYSYTSDKGTDKTLKDRQEEFKKRNISVCEENCDFTGYDNKTKKAVCSCFTKIELLIVSAIKVNKKQLFSNFKNIKNVANFQMLKCIYLISNLKNIYKNTANYMMLFLYTFSKIALFVFMCYNNNKIKDYIKQFSLNKKRNK